MGTGAIRKNLPVAVLVLAAAGLGAAAVSVGNGEAVVERGFQRAIADLDAKSTSPAAKPLPVVAGSEEFWLTHLVRDAGALSAKPVSVGDRITISSNGHDRVLNVVTIDKLDSHVLAVSTDRPTPLLLVTCRDESNPHARPVRFLIEAGDGLPALSAVKTARTL